MQQHIKINGGILYPVSQYLSDNQKTIKEMVKIIRTIYPTQQLNFWVRGSSGSIIASSIMTILRYKNCHMNYVRKKKEECHDTRPVYIYEGVNIFIDDFICTGDTVEKVCQEMCKISLNKMDVICVSGPISSIILEHIKEYLSQKAIIICEKIN